jgi:hypothetical protein
MIMNAIARLALVLGALISFSCLAEAPIGTATAPKLSNDRVLSIAKTAAEAERVSLSKFEEPRVNFDSQRREWFVFFSRKSVNGLNAFGNDFAIAIDDSTGKTRLVRGQ